MRRITFLFLSALLMLSALPLRADVNYLKEPFTIETTPADNITIGFIQGTSLSAALISKTTNAAFNLEYRMQTNDGDWSDWTTIAALGSKPTIQSLILTAGTKYKIQFRGNNASGLSSSSKHYRILPYRSGSTNSYVTMSGNIMSLLKGYDTDNLSDAQATLAAADEIPCTYCFTCLFSDMTFNNGSYYQPHINAENLIFPAEYLMANCYDKLFYKYTLNNSYGVEEGPTFLATACHNKSGSSVTGTFISAFMQCAYLKSVHFNFTSCPTSDEFNEYVFYTTPTTKKLYSPCGICSNFGSSSNWSGGSVEWSYTPPAETYTVTWKDYDNTTIRTDVDITSGTATSAPSDPTRAATDEYTYTFTGWSPTPAATVTADATYTATYSQTPRSYTLTWQTDGNTLTGNYTTGSTAYGTTIVRPDTPTKNADQQYTYTFNAWSPAPAATMPAANTTYTATWNRTTNRYTVSFASMTNGTISVKDAEENTINSGDEVDYGTILTITATPASGYEFGSWMTGTSANVTVTDNITLGANFIAEVTPEIELYDNAAPQANNSETTNSSLLSTYTGRTVNVTLYHNFTANLWNTLCLPFNLSTDECPELEGNVYELADCTTGSEGMTITFQPVTWKPDYSTEMIAGKPYLVWTERPLSSLRFTGVTLSTFTAGKTSAPSGDVDFQSVFEQGYLTEKSQIFIGSNNRLYYANPAANGGNGTRIRGYRAYFEILDTDFLGYYSQPRVRIVVNDDKNTVLTFDEEQTEMETRKYIENGVLVIERGGVKYNAQGKRL